MEEIDPRACRFALSKIEDGFIFESFAQRFLSSVLGASFMPVGGIKDRGIDGLEYLFARKDNERVVYQCSIEKTSEAKLISTLNKLSKNKVEFERFAYVTNCVFPNKDKSLEHLISTYKKSIQIFDLEWFASNVNSSAGTASAYTSFVDSYLHEFQMPGASHVVGDLVEDPRLFVFLRQQWESKHSELALDELLADTLILYALEGTDPDKHIFKSKDEIISLIKRHLKFEPKLLSTQIEKRLTALSTKPRKINHHESQGVYCLPFETRLELTSKNLLDASLHEDFRSSVSTQLKTYLNEEEVQVRDCIELIDSVLNQLFYRQGLEFANLLVNGDNHSAFEKSLPDTISIVVDASKVLVKNRQAVKTALLVTIRDVIYNGSEKQKQYLKCLSSTYMMLFLLQCDPKVATFFSSMASKLEVFVCTSILIPVMAEFYLNANSKRYWNLLVGAHRAGVKLRINDAIIDELVGHIRKIKAVHREEYSDSEEFYDSEELILYVREMLIRAYFYAKLHDKCSSFDTFIENFCSPDLKNCRQELIDWLGEEFGIEFFSAKQVDVEIDPDEFSRLETALKDHKGEYKSVTDAKLILTIFALREKNNESAAKNWGGFRTWWLSSDIVTQKVVNEIFGEKYQVSCYMRPDFLYNYISLAPAPATVKEAYSEIFPNLLGVNISHNLPDDVLRSVRKNIQDHKGKNSGRLKAALRGYSDRLKSDPSYQSRAKLEHFFEEQLRELNKGE